MMTYTNFLYDYLQQISAGIPIYTKTIAEEIAKYYDIDLSKATAATSVALKRIIDGNKITNLKMYQKGIYYKTKATPFGEIGINKEQLIADKYILPDIGYETGLSVMHRIGLTSQVPKEIVISTNMAKDCVKTDEKLGVVLKPPKAEINADNKYYLQILDVLDYMDRVPIDSDQPYSLVAKYISERKLEYGELLAYADLYYNKKTVFELAHTASLGGDLV